MTPGLEAEPDLLKPQTEKGQLSPQTQKDKAKNMLRTQTKVGVGQEGELERWLGSRGPEFCPSTMSGVSRLPGTPAPGGVRHL